MSSTMVPKGHQVSTASEELMSELQMYFYERPKRVRAKKSYREYLSDEENTEFTESKLDDDAVRRRKAKGFKRKEGSPYTAQEKKQQQLSFTITWLGDNYELKEGMCLPRCVMYTHYLDFCKKNKLCPSGPATFGKVIRQKFPKLTTRRLGTRGQSKYHYYGIRVKESSQYFHAGYSKQGLSRFSTMKAKGEGGTKKFSLNSKSRTLLPDFPNAKRLNFPKGVSQQKVETFIMMYRTHCQRLLDTVISANFDGINTFILHFWQGMPSHMITVLQNTVVVDVIAICDSILYKVLIDVLIPSTIQDLPDSLREEIREFANNLQVWLRESLAEVPAAVREAKLKVAEKFSSALKRQVSFVHLAQTARSVLLSYDSVSRMIGDLRKIDFSLIMSKAMFLLENHDIPSKTKTFVHEFDGLLSKQAPLEAYTEWLDTIVDRCILKDLEEDHDKELDKRASKFLGLWSFITSKILEDLTLRSAPSFGVFHLIHATFQEYIMLVVENQKMDVSDKQLQAAMQQHLKEEYIKEGIDHWVDVDCADTVNHFDDHVIDNDTSREKTTNDNNNNNNNNNTEKIVTKTPSRKPKTSRVQVAAAVVKPANRPIVITNPLNPDSIRQSIISSTVPSNLDTTQHPLQTSVANVTMNGRPSMQQYMYPDEVSRNATQGSEMAGFHSHDFINAFDKSFFNPNVTVSNSEYLGSPWIPDNQSLTVLNNVNYDQTSTNGNMELGFHRTAEYGFNYGNDMTITNNSLHPYDIQTPLNHRSDISYNQQAKEVDYSNYSNTLSRYNTLYYDNMRTNQPALSTDMLNYGMGPNTSAPMDIDGILAHEAQMNRLGIGAV